MLYTKLFGKTKKETPADEVSKSARLLIQAGYIQKEMAGVYAFLPLGKRVLDNIIQVIREEMEAIGGQEIHLGALQNPEIWETTDRWSDEGIDVWFKTQLKTGAEVGLATTHEEPLTKLVSQYVQSYRDLPVYLFQFQTKFRNELRSKSGILRTREFIMKDLYSFNTTGEALDTFYEEAQTAYFKVFNRLGLGDKTYLTFASGGPFSKYSHEFQTICDAGEDTIYVDEEKKLAVNDEVYTDQVLQDLGLEKENLKEVPAVEVGNIFKLKDKYSKPLGLTYTDSSGVEKPVIMGSYGIGPARCMGTIVEVLADKEGIVWPAEVAPFKVHIVGLGLQNAEVAEKAQKIYKQLQQEKVEVLFDDRADVSAGEKFADADLIGIPYRLVVSGKTSEKIEFKARNETEAKMLTLPEILAEIS
ncbi:prolyl-tRNA synthetase [candidate division WWE3 bacterium]|nr:prolyl-tRNA synthetase [candidate division WWE3 bacterium]